MLILHKNHNFLNNFNPKIPMCIDLDGTLITEDITIISLKTLFKKSYYKFILNLIRIQKGRKSLKSYTNQYIKNITNKININFKVMSLLNKQKQIGRKIVLATAANKHYGKEIRNYLPIFKDIIASNKNINIRSIYKSRVLRIKFQRKGFIYIGNSQDDIRVWIRAQGAICVNTPITVETKISKLNIPYFIIK